MHDEQLCDELVCDWHGLLAPYDGLARYALVTHGEHDDLRAPYDDGFAKYASGVHPLQS